MKIQRRNIGRCIEVRHLTAGVNAGISAAGADHGDLMSYDTTRRLLDEVLHRSHSGLALPAVEIGAIVGDDHSDVAHCENSKGLRYRGSISLKRHTARIRRHYLLAACVAA